MMKTLKNVITAGLISTLAACASTPEPIIEQVAAPAPAPVATLPAPEPAAPAAKEPVTQDSLADARQAYAGPQPGSLDDFVFTSGGDARVYFGYNEFTLTPSARDTLRRQADWLNTYTQVAAVIEGNADERGTREYNLALGARRADSVKAFLVSQGVAPSRLTTVSYGKERPIDGGSTETAWARNRNGHTSLMVGTIG